MAQLWLTGDTHGATRVGLHSVDGVLSRLRSESFPEQKQMTKEDMVVILGDFGLILSTGKESSEEANALNWLEKKPFSTCFVDGNHENFDRLYTYPEEDFQGGRVHRVRKSVRHLCRGYVFDLCGVSCFVFGGARSHDISDGILDPVKDREKIRRWKKDPEKSFRVKGETWWPQEMPNEEEMERGRRSLDRVGWEVSLILTHDAPSPLKDQLGYPSGGGADPLEQYFDEIHEKCRYEAWCCGHLHANAKRGKDIVLYEQLIRVR